MVRKAIKDRSIYFIGGCLDSMNHFTLMTTEQLESVVCTNLIGTSNCPTYFAYFDILPAKETRK